MRTRGKSNVRQASNGAFAITPSRSAVYQIFFQNPINSREVGVNPIEEGFDFRSNL